MAKRTRLTIAERLWAKRRVERNGCWTWLGTKHPHGYGQISVNGRTALTHRVMYETLVEPIPDGMHTDHLCRNKACMNPTHLEVVTPAENTRRGQGNVAKTHCPKGHPYDAENTYLMTDKGYTRRRCRTCLGLRPASEATVRKSA